MTDWKDNRYFRIMAVDHGILSWTDVQYRPDTSQDSHWPVTLVTWPPGAGTRAGDREPLYRILSSTHVRILVFSDIKVMRVSVSIDGGDSVECAGQLLLHPSRHGTLIKPSGEKNDRKSRPGRWLSALSSRGSHLEVSSGL